jgi:hypothetical protein
MVVLSHPFGKLRAGSFANFAKGWGTRVRACALKKQILRAAQDDSRKI